MSKSSKILTNGSYRNVWHAWVQIWQAKPSQAKSAEWPRLFGRQEWFKKCSEGIFLRETCLQTLTNTRWHASHAGVCSFNLCWILHDYTPHGSKGTLPSGHHDPNGVQWPCLCALLSGIWRLAFQRFDRCASCYSYKICKATYQHVPLAASNGILQGAAGGKVKPPQQSGSRHVLKN